MRRKGLLTVVCVLALAAAIPLVALLMPPGSKTLRVSDLATQPSRPLNVPAFQAIKPGMTQAQVEALLGGPPGNFGSFSAGSGMATCEGIFPPPGSADEKRWCDDENRLEIWFDAAGIVVGKHKRASYSQGLVSDPPAPEPNWLERVRAWLGR